jgi:hypothetical protein
MTILESKREDIEIARTHFILFVEHVTFLKYRMKYEVPLISADEESDIVGTGQDLYMYLGQDQICVSRNLLLHSA